MSKGISQSAAKHVYKQIVARSKSGEDTSCLDPKALVEEQDLWLGDMWTHLGHCLVTCVDNPKLVQAYRKGQAKVMETLIGKTVKSANMTVDAELIREMMPDVITRYFSL